jgi:hypothetical protein
MRSTEESRSGDGGGGGGGDPGHSRGATKDDALAADYQQLSLFAADEVISK